MSYLSVVVCVCENLFLLTHANFTVRVFFFKNKWNVVLDREKMAHTK